MRLFAVLDMRRASLSGANNVKFVLLPLYLALEKRPDVSGDVLPEEGQQHTAAQIAEQVVDKVRPGSIILLHPMYEHTKTSQQAIPLIENSCRQKDTDSSQSPNFSNIDRFLKMLVL